MVFCFTFESPEFIRFEVHATIVFKCWKIVAGVLLHTRFDFRAGEHQVTPI